MTFTPLELTGLVTYAVALLAFIVFVIVKMPDTVDDARDPSPEDSQSDRAPRST